MATTSTPRAIPILRSAVRACTSLAQVDGGSNVTLKLDCSYPNWSIPQTSDQSYFDPFNKYYFNLGAI